MARSLLSVAAITHCPPSTRDFPKFAVQLVQVPHAVQQPQDRGRWSDRGREGQHGACEIIGLATHQQQVEGLGDVLCEHRFYVTQRCVAGRADDHEAGSRELLGALEAAQGS